MFVEVKKKNNPECIFNKLRRREAARKLGLCRRNHVKACELGMKIHGQNMKQSCRFICFSNKTFIDPMFLECL